MAVLLGLITTAHAQDTPRGPDATPVVQADFEIELQPAPTSTHGQLDLRPPKITDLYTPRAIEHMLAGTRRSQTIEEVEVEGRRGGIPVRTPDIPIGPLALVWAVLHPTQAWRLLLPLPPDQAVAFSGPPSSATNPYRPVMLPPN
jgi:hypothetical protein